MKFEFKEGFSVFKLNNNEDIAIVVPHCGPALYTPTSNDANSETVASLLWRTIGGKLILSNLSRKRSSGIDFNRKIPSMDIALERFNDLHKGKWMNKNREFKDKYAFAAIDEEDYKKRCEIYKNFWNECKKSKIVFMVHRALPRVKAYPSIIDVVTFDGEGVNREKVINAVNNLNEKYKDFFKDIEKDYKEMIMFEEKRFIHELSKIFRKNFNMDDINYNYSDELEQNINKIGGVVESAKEKLYKNFDKEYYFECVRKTIDMLGHPKITVEKVFTGKKALGPKEELFPNKEKIILEIEPNRFLNFWYPMKTSRILKDLIEEIKKNKKKE